jgi:hypothetical protein
MGMIWSTYDHGIDILRFLVKHLSKIMIPLGRRILLEDPGRSVVVKITQSAHSGTLASRQIVISDPTYTHSRYRKCVTRSLET